MDWVTCPYCAQSTGAGESTLSFSGTESEKTMQIVVQNQGNNTVLWNVCIIAITLGILFWPHGIFDISLYDRATVDCLGLSQIDEPIDSNHDGMDGELLRDCNDERFNAQASILFVLLLASIALIWNNTTKDRGST